MSWRISSSASGRANIASRTPQRKRRGSGPDARPPTAQRPTGTPMSCTVTSSRAHSPYTAAIESVSAVGQGRFPPGQVAFERMDSQVGHVVLLR